MRKPNILVIDDDEAITSTVSSFLTAKGYSVKAVNDGEEALEEIRDGNYPIIVSDIYIDRVTGLDILEQAKTRKPDVIVILMTARGSVRTAAEAEVGGAFEYLAKPFAMQDLLKVIERAQSSAAYAPAKETEEDLSEFGGIIGFAPRMVEVYKRIARFAKSDDTVLITGETGTGKELVARAIHEHSARSGKLFVAVDAGAISGALWESELFGAVRGAFTGADRDRPGVVETAKEGALFFDEIGEIPLDFQAKLLRFLQEREYRPVGASAPRTTDVRVIAATNRRLEGMVQRGEFREDLYHRLNVLRIDVPPLRERLSDIPLLAERFLAETIQSTGKRIWLEREARELLEQHNWPGNVRELQNVVRRVVALNPAGPVGASEIRRALVAAPQFKEDQGEPAELSEVERRQILRVLEQTGGNKTRAAEILGIQRRTLYKKLARIEGGRLGHTSVPKPLE